MSLLKDTGACAFDGVTLLLKLIADKQMKHAKTSLLVKSSSCLYRTYEEILSRLGYTWVNTKLLECYFCVTEAFSLKLSKSKLRRFTRNRWRLR